MPEAEMVPRWQLELRQVPIVTKQAIEARAHRNLRTVPSEVLAILIETALKEQKA
jgi:hypothetical protein